MIVLRSRRLALVVSAALAAFVSPPAFANLLVNGSFEAGPATGAMLPLASGSTAVPGWVVTRAGIDYAGTAWTAAEGVRSIALNGPGAGGVAQTFASLPHALYTVRFYLAGEPETLPNLKSMRVTAAGQAAEFTADNTGHWAWDPGWNFNVWSFQATSTSTTIEFFSTMSGTTGATLDSVTLALTSTAGVTPPEPGVLALAPIAPNPVRGAARIRFALAHAGLARLALYDVAGREVAVLADGELAAGAHEAAWDGRAAGGAAPAGLYFAELRAGGSRLVRQFVVIH